MGISWKWTIPASGGQSVKTKKGEEIVTDKPADYHLKVTLKGTNSDVDEATKEIIESIPTLDAVTLTFSGEYAKLKSYLPKIAEIIGEQGEQDTLESFFEQPQTAK